MTFNIDYGSYIKPLEDTLCHRIQFGKGTNTQIAEKIYKLSKQYKYYVEIDHDTFDAHVTKEMLKLSHIFYQACYRHDRKLRQLSAKTLTNRCRTRDGLKYTVVGTRMSGDVDTSFGNSIINYAILKSAVRDMGIKCEVIVNGDDSIVFSNRKVDRDQLVEVLKTYNMKSKVQETTENIFKVEFCRSKLVLNSFGKPSMMINPSRINSIYGMTYKQQKNYVEYLRQVCICNIAINVTNPLNVYWKQIYKATFDKQIDMNNLKEMISGFDKIELRLKQTALKQLAETGQETDHDSGEFNLTTYQAWGNTDYMERDKRVIIARLKVLQQMGRINTETLHNWSHNMLIIIDHNGKKLMEYRLR